MFSCLEANHMIHSTNIIRKCCDINLCNNQTGFYEYSTTATSTFEDSTSESTTTINSGELMKENQTGMVIVDYSKFNNRSSSMSSSSSSLKTFMTLINFIFFYSIMK